MATTIIEIIMLYHLHRGASASNMECFVDVRKGDPFEGDTENLEYTTLRGETLGADPTRQKRGPRTSIWMRLRGRLPNLLALPRRASLATVGLCKNELITLHLSISDATEFRSVARIDLLTVGIVLARPSRGGSMAMAMAFMFATTPVGAFNVVEVTPRDVAEARLAKSI